MILTEILRLYLGFKGNLQDKASYYIKFIFIVLNKIILDFRTSRILARIFDVASTLGVNYFSKSLLQLASG